MMAGCWNCGSFEDCGCPTPEQAEKRKKLLDIKRRQEAHEASIKRQRGKFKPAPWRTDKSRGDYKE